jgi:hypothetical protein
MFHSRTNKLFTWLLSAVFLLLAVAEVSAQVRVGGYRRRDGTYVQPHYRSRPDGNFNNNWSTYGNVNPYTGKPGWIRNPPSGYGRRRSSRSSGNANRTESPSPRYSTGGLARSSSSVSRSIQSRSISSSYDEPTSSGYDEPTERKERTRGTRLRWRPKYPIDGLSEAQRAEHAQLAESLKLHGVDLYFWHLYSLEKLRDMEKRIVVAEQIRELGITDIDWQDFELESLRHIEQRLRDTEPRYRKVMFFAIR